MYKSFSEACIASSREGGTGARTCGRFHQKALASPNFEFFNHCLRVNSANTPLASVSKSEDRTNLTFFLYYVLVPDKDLVLPKMSLPLNVICVTYQRSSVKKNISEKLAGLRPGSNRSKKSISMLQVFL
jgi:hypothetical protein